MKIIIPNYSLGDSFVENVSVTLEKMGHTIISPPSKSRLISFEYFHLVDEIYSRVYPKKLTNQEKWLKNIIKHSNADILLTLTQSLSEEILLEAKKQNIITIAWWGDTAANMRKQGLLCHGWDFIYIKDRYAAFKLRTLGLNAYYLPEAMNPLWHKPLYNINRINNSILFAGNTYDYRHFLVRQLIDKSDYDIKIFGFAPPKWADHRIVSIFSNKFITKEEKSLEFGNALACINSTAMSEGNSLNCRAFEIAGAAGLQIMEFRPAIEDCFEIGKEILVFSSIDELIDQLNRYSVDKVESQKIRLNGHNRANTCHTYEIRLNYIFSQLK
jgi:spore maturation protein CgeB